MIFALSLVHVQTSDASPTPKSPSFNRKLWIEDYLALRKHVASVYANLEDKVASGTIDPFALNQRTVTALNGARSDKEALRAVLEFIGAFQDGHFRITNMRDVEARYLPERIVYPLAFSVSEAFEVRVQKIDGNSCKDLEGQAITRINGQKASDVIGDYERLVGEGNRVGRRQMAAAGLMKGSFAPESLQLDGVNRDGKRIRCTLSPKLERREGPPGSSLTAANRLDSATGEREACEAMGIRSRKEEPTRFLFDQVGVFEPAKNTSAYHAGYWRPHDAKEVAYWRIHAFGEYGYLKVCQEEWAAFRASLAKECDGECQWQFQYRRMVPRLIAEAQKLMEEINARKIETLVIDVSGNGGGGDWVDSIARMASPRSALSCQKIRRLKHKTTASSDEGLLADVRKDLANKSLLQEDRELLIDAEKRLTSLVSESQQQCDLQGFWTTRGFKPRCSLLTKSDDYACGLFPYLPPDALKGAESRQPLFKALDQPYVESVFKGRLVVAVDRDTSSSAEYFPSMLRDNDVATIVGEQTGASGCGYINGALPVHLPHSGIDVKMSNCVRIRKDGRNEVFGVEPDVKIPWVGDDPLAATQELAKLVTGIRR